MPKHYKEMMDEIINKIDEDAPVNAVGSGANVSLPPTVEPGVKKKKDDKRDPLMFAKPIKRRIKESDDNNNVVLKSVIKTIEKLEDRVDDLNGVKKEEVKIVKEEEKKTFHDKFIKDLLNNTPHAGQFDEDI